MNILELLQSDGITPKRVASTRGGEYASPCPLCGGTDRFRSWPEQGDGGKWWCRQCGKGGDLIQYCREVRRMEFKEACLFLGEEMKIKPSSQRKRRRTRSTTKSLPTFEPKEGTTPKEKWQEQAKNWVSFAEKCLWSNRGKEILWWLETERFLTEATIRKFHLGWMTWDYYQDRETWGLKRVLKSNGRPRKLWLPRGLVIPFFADDKLLRLRVRRFVSDGPPYVLIPGSSSAPFTIGKGDVLMVVESELDAILLSQEAGDLLSCIIALGSAQKRPDREMTNRLDRAEITLVALDADEAGGKNFWQWWYKQFPNCKRWPTIYGKDPTEARKNGLDLREWVYAGLPEYLW